MSADRLKGAWFSGGPGNRSAAMRANRFVATSHASLCALALAMSPLAASAAQGVAPAREHLRVAFMPFASFAVFTLAQKEGYFAEQGLEVEFVALDRTYKGIPALASGELDVHSGTPNAAIFNCVKNGSVKSVKIIRRPSGNNTASGRCRKSRIGWAK